MKKLTTKQKKAVKWFVLILCFLWNTLYSVYEFFNTLVAEPFRYIYNDSIFSLGDTADYLFPDLEVWGWYVIISSIVYFAAYIVYFIKSAVFLKKYGNTKALCKGVLTFTIIFSAAQSMPSILSALF